jgi:nucleotide-binding universal stress UspA family protein
MDAAQSPGVDGAAAAMTVEESLRPLLEHARKRDIPVEPISRTGRDIAEAVAAVTRQRQVDLILMGYHRAVLGKALLGGAVHRVLATAPADVGVFVDRGFLGARRVLVPYLGTSHDRLALELAARMGRNGQAEVTVLHVVPPGRAAGTSAAGGGPGLGAGGEVDRAFRDPTQPSPVHFRVVEDASPVEAVLREAVGFDLIVVGVAEEWGTESHLLGFRLERIAEGSDCSLLLVRKYVAARADGAAPPKAEPAEGHDEPTAAPAAAPV